MFKIYDGRKDFYQWDIDRKIVITDETIDEVHFCNKTDDCSLVVSVYEEGGKRMVNVPNLLLQDAKPIWVYGYCGSCFTKNCATFNVKARTKPADYIYTETELKTFASLEKKIEEGLAAVDTKVDGKIGDIETALDGIISLQNYLIGGNE